MDCTGVYSFNAMHAQYQVFAFCVGFALIFRTQISYASSDGPTSCSNSRPGASPPTRYGRYWESCTDLHNLRFVPLSHVSPRKALSLKCHRNASETCCDDEMYLERSRLTDVVVSALCPLTTRQTVLFKDLVASHNHLSASDYGTRVRHDIPRGDQARRRRSQGRG